MFALLLYLLVYLLFLVLIAMAVYFIYKPSIIYFRDNFSSNPNGSLKQTVLEAMDFPYNEFRKAYRNGTSFCGKIITKEDRKKMFLITRLAKQKKSIGWAITLAFILFGVLFGGSDLNASSTALIEQAKLDAQNGVTPRSNNSAYMDAYIKNVNNNL